MVAREDLLQRVKRTIREAEPDAEVQLFGSRAGGAAAPDSDWDFLILVDGPCDDRRKDRIRHRLYEIEWDSGEVLCSIICSRQDWESSRYRTSPFQRHVSQEGVPL
jgi:predicted nucleotidyltransferase